MVLVWISVVIIGLALLWLIGSAIGSLRDMKKIVSELSKTQAHIQEKVEKINTERDTLNGTISGIQSDIDNKKSSVNEVVLESKFLKNNMIYLFKNVKKKLKK